MKRNPIPGLAGAAIVAGVRRPPVARGWVAMAVLAVLLGPAEAAKKGDPDIVQTLNKAQGMLRQLSQEKAELEARQAETAKALEDAQQALDAKLKENQQLQADLKQKTDLLTALQHNNEILKKNNEVLKTNHENLKKHCAEQMDKAREQIQQLGGDVRNHQHDNALLVNAVKERGRWIEQCTQRNQQLIRVNREILDNFNNQSFWENLKEAEPLTGIGSVARENRIEEYRYRLNDLRVTPWQDSETGGGQQQP